MATATTASYSKFKILIGDGADPEVFSAICGLTSKGLNGSADVVTTEVPDCSDEDLPSWQEKDVKSISLSMSGSGVWSKENHAILLDWFLSGAKKNVQVQYVDAAASSPEFLEGPCVLTQLNNAAEKGGRMTAEITLDFAQKPTVTDAS